MSPKTYELLGQTFGVLRVIGELDRTTRRERMWLCLCTCGETTAVPSYALRTGHTKSCGCASNAMISEKNQTHGASNTQAYKRWCAMWERCTNPDGHHLREHGNER